MLWVTVSLEIKRKPIAWEKCGHIFLCHFQAFYSWKELPKTNKTAQHYAQQRCSFLEVQRGSKLNLQGAEIPQQSAGIERPRFSDQWRLHQEGGGVSLAVVGGGGRGVSNKELDEAPPTSTELKVWCWLAAAQTVWQWESQHDGGHAGGRDASLKLDLEIISPSGTRTPQLRKHGEYCNNLQNASNLQSGAKRYILNLS